MTSEFGDLNGEYCAGLVITADSLTDILATQDYTTFDPYKVTWYRQKGSSYEPWELSADETDLEGTDYGVAVCRSEYDVNNVAATQKYFCCQMLAIDGEVGFAISTIGKATKNDQESFELEGSEVTMGALVF